MTNYEQWKYKSSYLNGTDYNKIYNKHDYTYGTTISGDIITDITDICNCDNTTISKIDFSETAASAKEAIEAVQDLSKEFEDFKTIVKKYKVRIII